MVENQALDAVLKYNCVYENKCKIDLNEIYIVVLLNLYLCKIALENLLYLASLLYDIKVILLHTYDRYLWYSIH